MTMEEIEKNQVNTINQYKVLEYLKRNINIHCFNILLFDNDTIQVIDKNNEVAYFRYDNNTKDVLFIEDLEDIKY